MQELTLNVSLLKRRVPNLTAAAPSVGLRPATVSDLTTGKISVGRAEVRTLVALASLAECTLDELVVRAGPASMVETGLKTIDLFAPLVRGGAAGLIFRPGIGGVVLLAEVFRRLREHRDFVPLIWLHPAAGRSPREALPQAAATAGSLDEMLALIEEARAERDVIVGADRSQVVSGELLELRERLQEPGARPVTFALYDLTTEARDLEAPFGPLDTLWQFSSEMFARGLFPAIDALPSTSVLLEGAQLEAEHQALAARARSVLRRYREVKSLLEVRGSMDRFTEDERLKFHRGERLEAFLTQPYYEAESFTNKPGVWVSLRQTLDGVRRILDGAADKLSRESLMFVGTLA